MYCGRPQPTHGYADLPVGTPADNVDVGGTAPLGPAPLDEAAQYQIVPAPRPNKEAKLRKDATELPHLLLHRLFNPYCEICLQAKLREDPH